MPDFKIQLAPTQLAQAINPWSWSFGQVGLLNINLGNAGDPAAEQRILDEVGTYGRQLGRIGDALKVLIAHADLSGLTKAEQRAIDALKRQLANVGAIKGEE